MKYTKTRLVARKSLRGLTIQVIEPDGKVVAGGWAPKLKLDELTKKVVEGALKKKVKQVVFDRGKHKYHGLVKKVADLARSLGLEF